MKGREQLEPGDLRISDHGNTPFGQKEKGMSEENAVTPKSVWSPLSVPRFRAFWAGMSLSTTAFWMQNIAVTWLMRDWTNGDPVMISLVQTALFLPVMLLSLPAGAIADMFDRKKFLIISQAWMMTAPLVIAVLVILDVRSPYALLAVTALLAVGNAMKLPTQSALIPSLIDKSRLPFAISLNSMAVNGGRIIGPAVAGFLLPLIGAMALFLGNSLIYLLYIGILVRLPPIDSQSDKSKVKFISGLVDLSRFVQATKSYRMVLIRGGLYFCVWSTILAIVPLLVENAAAFGILYGLFGLGAIVGASLYGYLSKIASRSASLTGGIALHAMSIGLLSVTQHFVLQAGLMAVIGVASFFIMTTLQVSTQMQIPDQIRGRGIALMTTVFMGTTALSSPIWGIVAENFSAATALQLAAGFSLICVAIFARGKIDPA